MKPFLVEGIIPHGFTELGARPKSGKSVLGLQLALAVASEHGILLDRVTQHGRVLYLALEDPERRIKERTSVMLGFDIHNQLRPNPRPERLDVAYEWPKWTQGGLEHLDGYLEAYPETVLVVLDTITDFRGPVPRGGGYDVDYDFSRALSAWTNKHDTNLLGITHTGKRKPTDDPDSFSLDMIQNTTGITAGADTVLVMARQDGIMKLFRSGRDLDDTDPMKLKQEDGTLRWSCDESQDGLSARASVLFALRTATKPMKPGAMASFMGSNGNAIRIACSRMLDEAIPLSGVVDGAYYLTERGPTNKPKGDDNAD